MRVRSVAAVTTLALMLGAAVPAAAAAAPMSSGSASAPAYVKGKTFNLIVDSITLGSIEGNHNWLSRCAKLYGHVYVHRNGKTWKFFDHASNDPVTTCENAVTINELGRAVVHMDEGAPTPLVSNFSTGDRSWVIDVDLYADGKPMLRGSRAITPSGSIYHSTGIMSSYYDADQELLKAAVEWSTDGYDWSRNYCPKHQSRPGPSGSGDLLGAVVGGSRDFVNSLLCGLKRPTPTYE